MSSNSLRAMIQPTRIFTVNLVVSTDINLQSIDEWFTNVLEINQEVLSPSTEVAQLVARTLLLIKTLLQAVKIPAFYTGEIVSITPDKDDQSKYRIKIAVAYIDMMPQKGYIDIINTSFKVMLWMMQNQPTSENIEILYTAMLNTVIQDTSKMIQAGKSPISVLRAAYVQKIPFIHLGAGVYQLGWGSKSRKMDRSTTDCDSAIGSKLSQNKVITANLIRMAGFPGPVHGLVTKKEDAIPLAHQLGYPVVIKPSDLDRGEGVSVDIQSDIELLSAFEEACSLSKTKQIIVEKQVMGVCHRFFIAEGQLLYCIKRNPKSIKGDGLKSISKLIDEANLVENKKPIWLKTTPFPKDDLAFKSIRSCGYTLESVPKAEEWVPLRPIESTQWGIRSEDFTQYVHPDNIDIAIRAAALFELDVAGIDIITADISVPWYENGAIINEVNYAPILGGGEITRGYIADFLNRLLSDMGRIPIEIFVCNETSVHTAHQRQKELIESGIRCFLTTHTQTLTHEKRLLPLTHQSVYQRCKSLLLNKQMDALVVVIQTDEVLHTRLPFDRIDKLTIHTNRIFSGKDTEKYATEESFGKLSIYLGSLEE
jgi:cyanophycin synthetase